MADKTQLLEAEVDRADKSWLHRDSDPKARSTGPTSIRSYLSPIILACFIFPATAGMMFGYSIGVASGALGIPCVGESDSRWGQCDQQVQPDRAALQLGQDFRLTDLERETITSLSVAGALFGSFLAYFVGDLLGRRREIMLGGCLYVLGATIQASAPYSHDFKADPAGRNTGGLVLLCLGQLVYGLGIAFSMHGAPVYIAEVAPPQVRGLLISLKEGLIVGGIMLGTLVSYGFSTKMHGWRFMYGVAAIGGVVVIVGMYFLPPSPRWLLLSSSRSGEVSPEDRSRVIAVLNKIRPGSSDLTIDREYDEILDVLKGSQARFFEMFEHKRALIIGWGLVLFQQITGQPSVLYYSNTIFASAGFGSSAYTFSTVVSGAKLIATLITVFNVDKAGRRPLLFIGVTGMVISLMLLGIAFHTSTNVEVTAAPQRLNTTFTSAPDEQIKTVPVVGGVWKWVTVVSLMLYVSCYQIGFGPISWLMISEVFPLKVRGKALSSAVFVNFGSNLLVSLTFITLSKAIPKQGSFFLYGAIAVVSLIFIHFLVPETKGKSLEEIQEQLKGSKTSPTSYP